MARNSRPTPPASAARALGASPRSALTLPLSAIFSLVFSTAIVSTAWAGDILRGGAAPGSTSTSVRRNPESQVDSLASKLSGNANDALARTSQAIDSVRTMQTAARELAARKANVGGNFQGQPLPAVPNGLRPGGLEVDPEVLAGNTSLWKGARLPFQSNSGANSRVVIQQEEQTAVLNWKTFNVGKDTTVFFNQGKGGDRKAEWIAFNKINDPKAVPSQILGSIKAEGQVYLINRNGIIFGGASVIDVHTLVASALPINDNLIKQGLLNNRDAQFLFSALPVPGGSDGTPAFNPTISDPEFRPAVGADTYTLRETVALDGNNVPLRTPEFALKATNGSFTKLIPGTDYSVAINAAAKTATATFTAAGLAKINGAPVRATYTPVQVKSGDVIVQAGASMLSPVSPDRNGGRLMFVGSNVTNAGELSTPAGQTILAAGLQVGMTAHASGDPSLRGLDIWVGAVDQGTGTATNSGIINALEGSVTMNGKAVNQLGVIESSTSVNLNGRIDLQASYGAVSNPNFDSTNAGTSRGSGLPPFVFQYTGVVELGADSITRILPDYLSTDMIPGFALPVRSQINIEGHAIHFGHNALLLAPNANLTIRAGKWNYIDANGDRTVFGSTTDVGDPGLGLLGSGGTQRLFFTSGQIYVDASAMLNVAGSTDVFVPLAHSILEVEFRGAEFADSPVQRAGVLRATPLVVDLRRTGAYQGRFWMGTPLGDVTGLAGLITRNVAQLTAEGGNVTLQAGNSIVVQNGATIDVSGGYFRHEAGMVKTSRLLQNGRLVNIADAVPDQVYDGIYTGEFTRTYAKWGISETFTVPWMTGEHFEQSVVSGAAGGSLDLTAPSMAIDGELLGRTVEGPRQRSGPPDLSSLSLKFNGERYEPVTVSYLLVSPVQPTVTFQANVAPPTPDLFALDDAGEPLPLRKDRRENVVLSPELFTTSGFGHLIVENTDGDIRVPEAVQVATPARGSLTATGSNITILGDVSAPAGNLTFTALNLSPEAVALRAAKALITDPPPPPTPGRGLFTLGTGASLSTAGLVVNDLRSSAAPLSQTLALGGGSISIDTYSAKLTAGGTIDVSGGVAVNARGAITYGGGGSLSIKTGRDFTLPSVIGGKLLLESKLAGYSGATGGTLSIQASAVQVGGRADASNTLFLSPDFFRSGGFTNYALTGIGEVNIAPGTMIAPVAENWRTTLLPDVVLHPELNVVGLRSPVSLSFTSLGFNSIPVDSFVDIVGNVVVSEGVNIVTDPGASVSFKGQTVTMLGSVIAPGGKITITGDARYPLDLASGPIGPFAQSTVYLGRNALLSTAGTAVIIPDEFGRRLGTLFPGGTISVAGNIIAEAGSVLDVSGAFGIFDLPPTALGLVGSPIVPANSGLNSPLWNLKTVPTRIDSAGGLIDLTGSELLVTDATLLGHAGGPTAPGGTLSIASNRFAGGTTSSADINLVVHANGRTIASSNRNLGVGSGVFDASGARLGRGYFNANRFTEGGFDSLDLGYKSFGGIGGNVEFVGPVSIHARGALRLAAGGIVEANSAVNLTAGYLAIGQPFLAPANPDAPEVVLFPDTSGVAPLPVPPTAGAGRLTLQANTVDVGTVSLQGIGRASLIADGGDVRGNGTFDIAGDLTIRAAQVYPTTLGTFNIFAYDKNVLVAASTAGSTLVTLASATVPYGFGIGSPLLGAKVVAISGTDVTLDAGANTTIATPTQLAYATGSVTITGSGQADAPLSAGGKLNIFASTITQGGTLRAPMGTITLGWDGTDFDLSDAAVDSPFDPVARGSIPVPVASQVTLQTNSLTSVSADGLLIPFGTSPDGNSWIDPTGVNVTATGLATKNVFIAGDRITQQRGSTIDLRGGGDLYAFRWIPGTGGNVDLLGTATSFWNATTEYQAGDLVKTSDGRTWSARVRHAAVSPKIGQFWSQVSESFAVLPDYHGSVAPYAPFSGYQGNTTLHVGDQIYLDRVPGLKAGNYTLLPRRYALLPGAVLVTPTGNDFLGTMTLADGATYTSGITFNQFSRGQQLSPVRAQYEVATFDVVRNRVEFADYFANAFMIDAAIRLDLDQPQRLPMDSGRLTLHGNTSLQLLGNVLTSHPLDGRGSSIDISSFADMYVVGRGGSAPSGATVVLKSSVLESWGASSLLIGGLRREGAAGTTIEVRTKNLTLDNPGEIFKAPEITLVSKEKLTLTDGSAMAATGDLTEPAQTFLITGDGALLRASRDQYATSIRTGTTTATTALLTLGAGSAVAGRGVSLDSSYGTALDPTASLTAVALTLGSGQISIVFGDPTVTPLVGSEVTPHLVIAEDLLADVSQVGLLTLRSYRTIDFYGAGTFGSNSLGSLTFQAGGIRGFDQTGGTTLVQAGSVTFSNPSNATLLAPPAGVPTDTFQLDARKVTFGVNAFSILGYADTILNAATGATGVGTGSFTAAGNLTINTPVFTGAQRASQIITATGDLILDRAGAATVTQGGGLGASLTFNGSSVVANTSILARSGIISLRANGAAANDNVTVGGLLDVSGTSREFFDLIRYSDAGTVSLSSNAGGVELLGGSVVSVAAPEGGGNAGTVIVSAGKGAFSASPDATFLGGAAAGQTTGSFILDAGTLSSFGDLNGVLNQGGFFEQRNLRVRVGDIVIANVGGEPLVARNFTVSTDTGNINVVGTIDVSGGTGETGGKISLIAGKNLVLETGSVLDASSDVFSSAGKGGEIHLEAGALIDPGTNLPDAGAILNLQGGQILLGVNALVTDSDANPLNDYLTPGTSAFNGQFQGTLHLRAPRTAANNEIQIAAIGSTIQGASSIVVEGYEVRALAGAGLITGLRPTATTLPGAGTVQRTVYNSAQTFMGNHDTMVTRLLGADPQNLLPTFVLAPGVEIINRAGDITIGQAGSTSLQGDWNLSDFRFGPKEAAGLLTLRASGDIVVNNALSDGFAPITAISVANGNSMLWLSQLSAVKTKPDGSTVLPFNTQSWSYRMTAGADLSAADSHAVLSPMQLAAGKGSLLVGEFYAPVPNTNAGSNPTTAALGSNGTTANTIANGATGTRYEVIRTGTGDIDIAAGRDVQLRNQFASIYTAGARIQTPGSLFSPNDFVVPNLPQSAVGNVNPSQTASLGVYQQVHLPQWSMAGGAVVVSAQSDIRRVTLLNGVLANDSTRQLPTNWLYRRGFVDPATGLFGGTRISAAIGTYVDPAASTAWWIDYTNFFQGIGALGGGNVSLLAGRDVINVDAVAPTNARMSGRVQNADLSFTNIAPDPTKFIELGGGDLVISAGHNIDGGVYYAERGKGRLFAGAQITTNAARSPSLGFLNDANLSQAGIQPTLADPLTWLPTTLFVGKSFFDVSARGNILLGPISNPFLLPQGNNNKFWYKTHFNTYSETAGASVVSFGGGITHREQTTLDTPKPTLESWLDAQNLFRPADNGGANSRASYFQPWLRLAETEVAPFSTLLSVNAPNLSSTAFAGDVMIVGSVSLFPSRVGGLELAASGSIIGLNPSGNTSTASGVQATAWVSSTINVSDSNPALFPGIASPLAFQQVVPAVDALTLRVTREEILRNISLSFQETGSYTGAAAAVEVQQALHAEGLLHKEDPVPIRLYAAGGDVTGLTLFAPKATQVAAAQDVSDVSLYIQHVEPTDISFVSAGRDVIPFNENSPVRSLAKDISAGNATVGFQANALAGDLQINGAGVLEVLAGRNVDLGTGPNNADGTGSGITSIGNARNPYLPLEGADLVVLTGISSPDARGPAIGLAGSSADFMGFIEEYLAKGSDIESAYLTKLGSEVEFEALTEEQKSVAALEFFYTVLRDAGRAENEEGSTSGYDDGFAAIDTLFGTSKLKGDILTRSRDIRTRTGGAILLGAPGGNVTMATDIFGNPQTPPGIVTEFGGGVSIFTDGSVRIGQARIFTLRGGDITIWASNGDIAAGNAPKTVVSAPPTRVVIEVNSANVQTDLGGLATGGGIGVLAVVENVPPGNVDLIAPNGAVDAGDAGIRVTGNLNIAAPRVLNAGNIQAGGTTAGVPSVAPPAAPALGAPPPPPPPPPPPGPSEAEKEKLKEKTQEEVPSIIEVELLSYDGGGV